MTAFSTGDLKTALAALGAAPERRAALISLLVQMEPGLSRDGLNVREEITGPVVDALHAEGELIRRTLASDVTISFPYRSKIARDFVMAPAPRPDHVWEPQTTRLLLTLGRSARTVIIGGAYFGDQAIPLANEIRARGTCHCFDINAEQIAVLKQNAAENGLTNVVVNQLGLWDKDGVQLVLVGDDSHAFAREALPAERDHAFPTTTIESYADRAGLRGIDLIMLDIEGAELGALRGAAAFLRQPRDQAPAVIFEVHRSYVDWTHGLDKTDLVRFLADLGYAVFAVRDYQGNVDMHGAPVELVPVDDIYLEGPPHGFNMLALKDTDAIARAGLVVTPGVSPKLLFHRDPRFHQPLHRA